MDEAEVAELDSMPILVNTLYQFGPPNQKYELQDVTYMIFKLHDTQKFLNIYHPLSMALFAAFADKRMRDENFKSTKKVNAGLCLLAEIRDDKIVNTEIKTHSELKSKDFSSINCAELFWTEAELQLIQTEAIKHQDVGESTIIAIAENDDEMRLLQVDEEPVRNAVLRKLTVATGNHKILIKFLWDSTRSLSRNEQELIGFVASSITFGLYGIFDALTDDDDYDRTILNETCQSEIELFTNDGHMYYFKAHKKPGKKSVMIRVTDKGPDENIASVKEVPCE